jgi:amino acid adenylation domain-containing protein
MSTTPPPSLKDLSQDEKRALLAKLLKDSATLTPLSFAQQRLWFMDKLQPGSALYNVPAVLRLTGKVDFKLLQQALNRVVARHEALRTTFVSREGVPYQKVNSPSPVEFHSADLRKMNEESRKEKVDRFVTEEVRRPFNLAEDLMIRAALLQTGDAEYILTLVVHHIASDEWSFEILFQEWADAYRALAEGDESEPLAPASTYRDYARKQSLWAQSEQYKKQLAYWTEKLAAPLPVLQLPLDNARPATQTYDGTFTTRLLPISLLERLTTLARELDCTLFMVLLAAFKVLMHRYTHQEDLIIGSPIAGRQNESTQGIIGFFVNTLALRSSFAGDPTFREFAAQVRKTTLEAYENQDVPFDKLVEELHPQRASSHSPIVQAMFSLEHEFIKPHLFQGFEVEWLDVDTGTAKFELILAARKSSGGLKLTAEYNTDLFDPERITRMLQHFEVLLESISANPDEKVSEVNLLPNAERHQILVEWNNTQRDYPRVECIHQVFERQVSQTPDATAVKCGDQVLTYRELNARANQLGHRLQKSKVSAGTLIGVYLDRSADMVTAFLAILKAGGAYVPLDPGYPAERLSWMIQDTRMPVILTSAELKSELPESGATVICLDSEWASIQDEPRQLPPNISTPESIAYVIYTSGSTGKPKGVMVPHKGVTRLVLDTDYVQIKSADKIAQASNASFDAATFEIWGALLNGATLIGISKDVVLSPADFATSLRANEISVLFLTTALFNQLARETPGIFSTLDTVLFGGEAVDPKWVQAVLECKPPRRLLHVYGPTENTTFSTWHPVHHADEETLTVPIGRPIANSTLYILDRNMRPVPIGITGEIYVGGDGLALGYWESPELTASKFVPNPFDSLHHTRLYKTGDLGRFDANGNVEFIGRIDHQVKLRGFRIELGEIEAVLAKLPGVSEAVVTVREDTPGDRRLVAYLVPAGAPPSTSELKALLRAHLPDHMIPSAFVFMEEFPLTPNEKIDRKALPKPDQTRPDLEDNYISPRDQTEEQLCAIWESILSVRPIGMDDNFFDLGGHSLLAVKLFSQIEKTFGRKLPLATLFRAPTIEQIARVLKEQPNQKQNWSTIVDIQPKGSRPPFFWIHSLGGDGGGGFFYYRKLAELLGPDQPSYGIRSPQQPFSRIEDMAKFYVEEIRKFQPHGPYYLGGFCFGGNVAFEMAQHLTQLGEPVGLLVMLETAPPNINQKQSWSATAAKYSIENIVENVKDFVHHSPQEKLALLKQKGKRLGQKFRGKIAPAAGPTEKSPDLKDVLDLSHYPKDYVLYAQTHWQALTHYQPRPYSGEITLFRAKKQGLSNFNHTLCWDALVEDRVSVTVIPGTHESMLQEPNVQIIAAKLRALLDDAYAKYHCSNTTELAASNRLAESIRS